MNEEIAPKVKKHRKRASQKQLIAIQLRSQGMGPVEAARKAGYSESVARVPKKVFTSQAIVTAVDKFKLELNDKGLTTDYMAAKIAEWLEATRKESVKISVDDKGRPVFGLINTPDYPTQQNAYKFFKEVALDQELKQAQKPEGQLTRKITLEEFITPDNTKDSETAQQVTTREEIVEGHINDGPIVIESNKEEALIQEEVII